MNRIVTCFADCRNARRRALILFIAAGDPSPHDTVALLHALVAGGADIIELGFPFSDPILDGPVIRQANRRVLDAGGSLDTTLDIVRAFRHDNLSTPIVLMGYANPIVSRGPDIIGELKRAQVDGLILPDLPLRECEATLPGLADQGLLLIPLLPPQDVGDADLLSTSGAGGFAYCIAQAGPTGGASPDADAVALAVSRCRLLADLPVGVGFGIRTPDDAASIGRHADAVIVGSALVDHLHSAKEAGADSLTLAEAGRAFAASFRNALDAAGPASA